MLTDRELTDRDASYIVAEVTRCSPDVLCLQEATPPVLAALRVALAAGGAAVHAVSKLELLEARAPLSAEDRQAVCEAGFLATRARVKSLHTLQNPSALQARRPCKKLAPPPSAGRSAAGRFSKNTACPQARRRQDFARTSCLQGTRVSPGPP